MPSTIGVVDSGQRPYPGHYINSGTSGGVVSSSTPAPDLLPPEATFIFKTAGPANVGGGIACHGPDSGSGNPNNAWYIRRSPAGSAWEFQYVASADGTGIFGSSLVDCPPSTGLPETLAFSIQQNDGAGNRVLTSHQLSGSTWSVWSTGSSTARAIASSTDPLRVGCTAVNSNTFLGQIFSVECRTGLDPTATASFTKGYFTFPATVGNYLAVPSFNVTDITVVARIRPTDWTPATAGVIACRWRTGTLSWAFRLNTAGNLQWFFSSDGTSNLNRISTVNLSSQPIDWLWVAVTFLANDGATNRHTKFWTSPDGTAWNLLGTTRTDVGLTTDLFDSTSPIDIGALDGGLQQVFSGDIQHVSIRDGVGAGGGANHTVGGTEIFRFDGTESADAASTSFRTRTGQTVTVNRAASDPKTTIVPNAGLLWRMDPSEHVSGNSWTDPRGRTWTLTDAARIVHAP